MKNDQVTPRKRKLRTAAERQTAREKDLVRHAVEALEAKWLLAWLKAAGGYLVAVTAYIGLATAFLAAWRKFVAQPGDRLDLAVWVLAAVLALPLLCALIFNVLPAFRHKWERDLMPTGEPSPGYFTTEPRTESDPHPRFESGYESFLKWAEAPRSSLLYLTGLSGSGKSSLLGAFLAPKLEAGASGAPTRVIILRSYSEPLTALKEALLGLWERKPADYDDLSPVEALRRASQRLGKYERLFVAFDQFEEYFLVHAVCDAGQEGQGPIVDQQYLAPLRSFFADYLLDPPDKATLLLAYREDHHRLLSPLALPGRIEGSNWMVVEPLDFASAGRFIRSCPNFKVPEARMDQVLREAARQEGGRVVMRPIVANFLGVILVRMLGHPTLWRRTGDLLRGYVRDCLGIEIAEDRVRLLRTLLTDFHTARPRTAAELAASSKLEAATLANDLESLRRAGLLRCLDLNQSEQTRPWQIAHDFLATLIERVLDGYNRTFWHSLRPWLTPISIVMAFSAWVAWPAIQKQRDIRFLNNLGFTWNESEKSIEALNLRTKKIQQLDMALVGAMQRLHPKALGLNGCDSLKNVDALMGLKALTSLGLNGCDALENVDALKGLPALTFLDLSGCHSLRNVDVLKGLTALTSLGLGGCHSLRNAEALEGLTRLTSLDLSGCYSLRDVDSLKGLTALASLDLGGCYSLRNVDGLGGAAALTTLDLSDCNSLQNVDGLKRLTALTALKMGYCDSLQNVDALKGLTALAFLDLHDCRSLRNVDVLIGLRGLTSLKLNDCAFLQNLDVLKELTALTSLDLGGCYSLRNVDGLSRLTALTELNLSYCSALQNVDELKRLTALASIDLGYCNSLQDVEALKEMTGLSRLRLSNCANISQESRNELRTKLPRTQIID